MSTDAEIREQIQVLAATDHQETTPTYSRRDLFNSVITALVTASVTLPATKIFEGFFDDRAQAYTFDDSFIRRVLSSSHNKTQLFALSKALDSQAKFAEKELVDIVLTGCSGFDRNFQAHLRLKQILASANLSKLGHTFLTRILSHQLRYLGLFRESANTIFPVREYWCLSPLMLGHY